MASIIGVRIVWVRFGGVNHAVHVDDFLGWLRLVNNEATWAHHWIQIPAGRKEPSRKGRNEVRPIPGAESTEVGMVVRNYGGHRAREMVFV